MSIRSQSRPARPNLPLNAEGVPRGLYTAPGVLAGCARPLAPQAQNPAGPLPLSWRLRHAFQQRPRCDHAIAQRDQERFAAEPRRAGRPRRGHASAGLEQRARRIRIVHVQAAGSAPIAFSMPAQVRWVLFGLIACGRTTQSNCACQPAADLRTCFARPSRPIDDSWPPAHAGTLAPGPQQP